MPDIDNDALRTAVLEKIVPYVMDLWQRKNKEYANVPFMFGSLGEVVEIVRKAMKLRAFIYLEEGSSDFEGPEQVAMDLIGHAFMLIYMLDPEKWDAPGDGIAHYHNMKHPHAQHTNSISAPEPPRYLSGRQKQCINLEPHDPHSIPTASGNLWDMCPGVSDG